MTTAGGDIVIIGVGNVLLRDDGIGVHVVRELGRRIARGEVALPAGTRIVDGGTLGRNLLPEIADARGVVLVDAVELGAAPGSVRVMRGAAARSRAGRLVVSREGAAELVEAAWLLGTPVDAVAVVGIQPGVVEAGLEPTAAVRAAIPAAVSAAIAAVNVVRPASARRDRFRPPSIPDAAAGGLEVGTMGAPA